MLLLKTPPPSELSRVRLGVMLLEALVGKFSTIELGGLFLRALVSDFSIVALDTILRPLIEFSVAAHDMLVLASSPDRDPEVS